MFFIDFRERGRGGEREEERETSMWKRNIDQFPPIHILTGDWTLNLGMCPSLESNPQPFGVWDNAPTNLTTWPWYVLVFLNVKFKNKVEGNTDCCHVQRRQWTGARDGLTLS